MTSARVRQQGQDKLLHLVIADTTFRDTQSQKLNRTLPFQHSSFAGSAGRLPSARARNAGSFLFAQRGTQRIFLDAAP